MRITGTVKFFNAAKGFGFIAPADGKVVMVTEVDEENGFVLVDTNHPLAGMTLEFEVSVVAVRDAPATAGCGKA